MVKLKSLVGDRRPTRGKDIGEQESDQSSDSRRHKVNRVQAFVAFICVGPRARTICISSSFEAEVKTITANFRFRYVRSHINLGCCVLFLRCQTFVVFGLDWIVCL